MASFRGFGYYVLTHTHTHIQARTHTHTRFAHSIQLELLCQATPDRQQIENNYHQNGGPHWDEREFVRMSERKLC